jgi:hypothetical protein
MKLYLVNQARKAVSQIFKDHGLKTQTPSKPSEVHALSTSQPSLVYTIESTNIHAHVQSEVEDQLYRRVHVTELGIEIVYYY